MPKKIITRALTYNLITKISNMDNNAFNEFVTKPLTVT